MSERSNRAETEAQLQALLDQYDRRPDTTQVGFVVARPATGWTWTYGNVDAPYFIASITKLYTTTVVMQLVRDGQVELDASIGQYLSGEVVRGLNMMDGEDRSSQITVRQLLAHTSGIADYFEQRRDDGATTFGRALEADRGWTFAEAVQIAKQQMRPKFAPGQRGRAYYSDTNYQLLGAIIESVTSDTYEAALDRRIVTPLELRNTYPFSSDTLERYDAVSPMLDGTQPIRIPHVMASVRADGGIVSSAAESMRFLRAFMEGEVFPESFLAEMRREWRRIFFPLQYGIGIMRFALPRIMTGFRRIPEMIGHSGASGAVAFHAPKVDLYVTGTVNQIRKRSLVYQLLTRIVMLAGR
jgi:CubicO group peptidase (beta-lactamase class C family)